MNKRKITTFAAAALAGVALPVAIGTTANGQGPTTTTTCAPGFTAPSPYCSVTTNPGSTTQPSGTTTTGTTPTTTVPGGANSGNLPGPKKFSVSTKKKVKKLPKTLAFKVKITPATGATCSGKLQTTVKLKKKTVAKKSGTLPANCKVTLKAKLKKFKGKKGKLGVTVSSLGNSTMKGAAKKLTIKFG